MTCLALMFISSTVFEVREDNRSLCCCQNNMVSKINENIRSQENQDFFSLKPSPQFVSNNFKAILRDYLTKILYQEDEADVCICLEFTCSQPKSVFSHVSYKGTTRSQ